MPIDAGTDMLLKSRMFAKTGRRRVIYSVNAVIAWIGVD